MTGEQMMGMLGLINPCDNPPGMSFDPANPSEIDPGQQVTLDIIGGLPPYTFDILEGSLFYIGDSYIAWPPGYSDTYVKATTRHSTTYEPWFSADPTIARNGTDEYTSWESSTGNPTEQRWNIDLGAAKIITQMMLENGHISGGNQVSSIKNFILQGSNDASALAQVDYSSDQYWTDIETGLQAAEHSALDYDDPQIFDITNSIAYRYLSLKIADNWGGASRMYFRHVQFHTSQAQVYTIITADPEVTIKAPAYALWTVRIRCTDACDQVADTFVWCTDGKWHLIGSESTGGTPTLCGNQHFRIFVGGCMFVGEYCNNDLPGISGDQVANCTGYGGTQETINIKAKCGGVTDCDYVKTLYRYCWQFP